MTFDNGTPGTTPAATADDLKHDYEYDVVNRLDTLAVQRGTITLFDQNYDYESDGQKDKVTEHRGAVTTVYDWTYDAINRLTDETYTNSGDPTKNYAANYKFDLASNRVGKTQTGANAATTANTYNARDELAATQTNGGPITIPQYDPDGNTITDGTRTFTWDLRNRMASVTVNGTTTTTYTYDNDDVRVSKTTNGTTRTFVNDALNPTGYSKPIEEKVNGTLDTSYVIGLSVIGQSNQTTGYLSLIQDGQGKARSVLNLSGVDVQPADYDAYGNTLQPEQTVTPWQNPDGYSDFENGLTQQWARSLNRQTGEWASEDSTIFGIDQWQNANLHVYVGGSPILLSDPSGHDALGTLATMSANVALFAIRVGIPVARVAGPLLSGISLYTFARDPLAAQQFIAEGGNPAALFEGLLHAPGLLAQDAKNLLVFGRNVLNAAEEANLAGREVNALRGAISNVSGATFSQAVLRSLGEAEENTALFTGMTRRGPRNVVPDLPVGVSRGVTDIKDVVNITNTPQILGFAAVAKQQSNLPFNLVISPRTQSIAGTVVDAINKSNGKVFQFDDATGKWSTINLNGFGERTPWRR